VTGKIQTFRDLKIWQNGMEVASTVYAVTNSYPEEERYGLKSQARRAAVSIPANIAEGCARNHRGEFRQFLYISLGSLAELQTLLELSHRLKFLSDEDRLAGMLESQRHMTLALLRRLK
jgi:four helix bundle protein